MTGWPVRAMQALGRAPQVVALLDASKNNEDAAYEVANRVRNLVHHVNNDPQRTHPFDVAIAAYLQVLSIVSPYLAYRVGLHVDDECKNLWWAVPVVERILETPQTKLITTEIVYSLSEVEPQQAVVRSTNKAGNNIISMIASSVYHLSKAPMKLAAGIVAGTTLSVGEGGLDVTIEQVSHVESVEMMI